MDYFIHPIKDPFGYTITYNDSNWLEWRTYIETCILRCKDIILVHVNWMSADLVQFTCVRHWIITSLPTFKLVIIFSVFGQRFYQCFLFKKSIKCTRNPEIPISSANKQETLLFWLKSGKFSFIPATLFNNHFLSSIYDCYFVRT